MYVVFKAYGKFSHEAYYGYTRVVDDVKEAFLVGARRPEPDRADVRLLGLNGGDESAIMIETLEIFEDEEEAWMYRNDVRASNSDTISGPTMFPCALAERVAKKHPGSVSRWKKLIEQREAKTARQAWVLGRWTNEAVKGLLANFKRADVVKDLDSCSPDAFAAKYAL